MDLVILVGLQGAGKSTFARARFAGTHTYVSKDQLRNNPRPGRRQKQLVEAALAAGQSVVIDNTNPTVQDRAELIELGRRYGARIIGYCFESRVQECLERNRQRSGKARVPDVAIFATRKRLKWPTLVEGFDELWYVRPADNLEFTVTDWHDGPMESES
jgi:predicted kinase